MAGESFRIAPTVHVTGQVIKLKSNPPKGVEKPQGRKGIYIVKDPSACDPPGKKRVIPIGRLLTSPEAISEAKGSLEKLRFRDIGIGEAVVGGSGMSVYPYVQLRRQEARDVARDLNYFQRAKRD